MIRCWFPSKLVNPAHAATLSVAAESISMGLCRLWGDRNHSAVTCRKYASFDDRREQVLKQ